MIKVKKLYVLCLPLLLQTISVIYAYESRPMMHDVIFREYDIRGKVGSELLIEQVYDLGKAIAAYLLSKATISTIALGMDGRLHSQAIRDELKRALIDSGINVIFIGTCPTPALYFATFTMPVDAGIMITASHNPKEYNGMKLVLHKEVVWGKQIQEIKQLYKNKSAADNTKKGTYTEQSIINAYISWIAQHFAHLKGMPVRAVVDCGNGAAGTVLPQLVKEMQWSNVQLLYAEVDGTYPNHEADPTVEKNMLEVKRLVTTTPLELGLGLDGDCDRMDPMTKAGRLVPGDQLLALFAQQVLKDHPGAPIVFDIKSSAALIEVLEKLGAQPCISPSGHSIIKDQMKKTHALIAGELSCHFFFHDRYFGYDDGIYAMMRLFEILLATGKTLDTLVGELPKKCSSPEYRIKCDDDKKNIVVQAVKNTMLARADVQALTIDGVRATMPYGWGLVRVSNTQPALTIRFESDSLEGLKHVKQDFYAALKPFFDPSWLAAQLEI